MSNAKPKWHVISALHNTALLLLCDRHLSFLGTSWITIMKATIFRYYAKENELCEECSKELPHRR